MLSPDVQARVDAFPLDSRPRRGHLTNLSRGLLSHCLAEPGDATCTVRIPSTWCEQKKWNDILVTLPPQMWILMSLSVPLVMHDVSEKPRETRAVWQGLSWIRFAVNCAWDLPVGKEISRSRMNVNPYWAKVFHELPTSTRNLLRYYLNFYRGDGGSVNLKGCDVCGKGSVK